MIWADAPLFAACETSWEPGHCYKLRTSLIKTDKYGEQLALLQIRPVEDKDRSAGFDPWDVIERSRFDPEAMFTELRGVIEANIADEPLRQLVLKLLDDNKPSLQLLPGSLKHYHPFAGGWLEHTLNVTTSCLQLAQRYRALYPDLQPPLNQDVLIAAAVLHDVGRLAEIADPLTAQPSVQGKLLGHLVLGRDLVRTAARDIAELDPERLLLLEHMLMSYLTLPEWGSPRLPAIPECLILHHADDLDAKMEMYVRCLTRDTAAGPFTDRDPILGKQLLKGRKV